MPLGLKNVAPKVATDIGKTTIKNEMLDQMKFGERWGWLVDECRLVTQQIVESQDFQQEEQRSVKPIPPTANGMYGWIATKKEFQLEKYGCDVPVFPLPKQYRINYSS